MFAPRRELDTMYPTAAGDVAGVEFTTPGASRLAV